MFDAAVIAAFKKHATSEYPKECCGGITPDGYVHFENQSANPREHFVADDRAEALRRDGKLLALVHSHPYDAKRPSTYCPGPSAVDMAAQMSSGVPYGIILTDGERTEEPYFWGDALWRTQKRPPLEQRDFRHGPTGTDGRGDCYALIRDWYAINRGITILDFARDDRWWSDKKNLYAEGFQRAGFVQLRPDKRGDFDLQPGDVFFAQIRSPVPNHAGLFIGEGRILHHLADRLSMVESIHHWSRLTWWVRYEGADG